MRSLFGILLWRIPLLYLPFYRSFWLNSDRNKVSLLSRLISSLVFQRSFVSLSAHLAVGVFPGTLKVPLSHAYPIMNGESDGRCDRTIAGPASYIMTGTSVIQPSAAGKSALSSEAIIGIIGLVLAAFVPLIGFLFRRVLFKTLSKDPTRCIFSTDPQLGQSNIASQFTDLGLMNFWPELGLALPTSTTGNHRSFITCTHYSFSTSTAFTTSFDRVNFWKNESVHLRVS